MNIFWKEGQIYFSEHELSVQASQPLRLGVIGDPKNIFKIGRWFGFFESAFEPRNRNSVLFGCLTMPWPSMVAITLCLFQSYSAMRNLMKRIPDQFHLWCQAKREWLAVASLA